MIASLKIKLSIAVLALATLMGAPATTFGQDEHALTNAARAFAEARVRELGLRDPVINLYFGDLTGTGTADAVAFIYHASGGSGEMLTTWILRESNGIYSMGKDVSNEELFGFDPRDVQLSPGRLSVTTTVPQLNDPHCCPTGSRTFVIKAN